MQYFIHICYIESTSRYICLICSKLVLLTITLSNIRLEIEHVSRNLISYTINIIYHQSHYNVGRGRWILKLTTKKPVTHNQLDHPQVSCKLCSLNTQKTVTYQKNVNKPADLPEVKFLFQVQTLHTLVSMWGIQHYIYVQFLFARQYTYLQFPFFICIAELVFNTTRSYDPLRWPSFSSWWGLPSLVNTF